MKELITAFQTVCESEEHSLSSLRRRMAQKTAACNLKALEGVACDLFNLPSGPETPAVLPFVSSFLPTRLADKAGQLRSQLMQID